MVGLDTVPVGNRGVKWLDLHNNRSLKTESYQPLRCRLIGIGHGWGRESNGDEFSGAGAGRDLGSPRAVLWILGRRWKWAVQGRLQEVMKSETVRDNGFVFICGVMVKGLV